MPFRRVSSLALAIAMFVIPLAQARAGDAAADKAPDKAGEAAADCRGSDLLAELATRDPAAYSRLESQEHSVPNGGAILWRIEKDGRPVSHVFGTVHLADERVTSLSRELEDTIAKSSTVLLEIADLSPEAAAQALGDATRLAIFTNGGSLERLLGPDDFSKVTDIITDAGYPGESARLFRPWVVTLLLASTDCERRKMKDGALVVDMLIARMARAHQIPVGGLETIDSQLSALSSIPEEQQIAMLKASLAYADRRNDLVETLIRLYLDRRTGAAWPFQILLAEAAGIPGNQFSAFESNIITDRNKRMRDAALPYLEKGGVFIAVGALHLPGKQGLVELFRDQGFKVTPVK